MKQALNLSSASAEELEISNTLLLYTLLEKVGGTVKVTVEDSHVIADKLIDTLLRVQFGEDFVEASIVKRPDELREIEGNA